MASGPITSWQIERGKVDAVTDFLFLGSKNTENADFNYEIRWFLLGRKALTNLDSVLKSRNITFLTKVHIVRAMVFPVVMYRCENWSFTLQKAEHQKTDAFELWCWRRLLRVSWTARRSNQSILKEIDPEYSLEGLILKLKLQYFGHLVWRADSLEKTLILGKMKAEGEKGNRGWDGWMASLIQWSWTWANSRRWWGTGKLCMLQFMVSESDITWLLTNNNNKVYKCWIWRFFF